MTQGRFRPVCIGTSRLRAAPFARRLVVMVKAPAAGRVKTRLARDIGVASATYFYRHMTAAVLRRVQDRRRWETYLAVSPPAACVHRYWPGFLPRVPQASGGLGRRMHEIMRKMPPGPVVIVGTDIPGIKRHHIAEAFAAVEGCDAAFGPAQDGGYWLVATKRRPRLLRMFDDVRWSTTHALADTLANLKSLRVRLTTHLADVDDIQEYKSQRAQAGRVVCPLGRWERETNRISARKT